MNLIIEILHILEDLVIIREIAYGLLALFCLHKASISNRYRRMNYLLAICMVDFVIISLCLSYYKDYAYIFRGIQTLISLSAATAGLYYYFTANRTVVYNLNNNNKKEYK